MRLEGLIDKRVCFRCGSDKTYRTKKGYDQWHVNKDDRLVCARCYYKQRIRNPEPIKRWNDYSNARQKQRVQSFRGIRYFYPYQIRCGVCNWCRAVEGIDTKYTNLHHDENRYDENNRLKFTLELCLECHGKEGKRLRG